MVDFSQLGKGLFWLGLVVAALGLIFWLGPRIGFPFGRLPGDIHISGERWSFYFPLMTCIVLSVVLTIILNIIIRFFR